MTKNAVFRVSQFNKVQKDPLKRPFMGNNELVLSRYLGLEDFLSPGLSEMTKIAVIRAAQFKKVQTFAPRE